MNSRAFPHWRQGVAIVASVTALLGALAIVASDAVGRSTRPVAIEHRDVCGPTARGIARCDAIVVLNPGALARPGRRSTTTTFRSTTTTTRPTTTSTTTSTTTTSTTTIPSTTTSTTLPAGSCTTAHAGFTPCDLQSAYNLPSTAAGVGQTVAIVDAYNDPSAESDLAVYRSTYGLPACTSANGCFKKVNQTGGSSSPTSNASWSEEISLDLDMVSAICSNCHIVLVEGSSASVANLATAENTAASLGANAISNSYGASEFSGETAYDSYFNHPGIAITASSGDGSYGVEWPAASPYVTAVGGTSLVHSATARGWSESAWNGAGSGCSSYEAQPGWQASLGLTGCSKRSVADVSAVANPSTGVAVYDSYAVSGWLVFGGTSVASPIVASVYTLAGNAASVGGSAAFAYANQSSLYDVVGGSNGTCASSYLCTAVAGYDGPTGLGSPDGTGAF